MAEGVVLAHARAVGRAAGAVAAAGAEDAPEAHPPAVRAGVAAVAGARAGAPGAAVAEPVAGARARGAAGALHGAVGAGPAGPAHAGLARGVAVDAGQPALGPVVPRGALRTPGAGPEPDPRARRADARAVGRAALPVAGAHRTPRGRARGAAVRGAVAGVAHAQRGRVARPVTATDLPPSPRAWHGAGGRAPGGPPPGVTDAGPRVGEALAVQTTRRGHAAVAWDRAAAACPAPGADAGPGPVLPVEACAVRAAVALGLAVQAVGAGRAPRLAFGRGELAGRAAVAAGAGARGVRLARAVRAAHGRGGPTAGAREGALRALPPRVARGAVRAGPVARDRRCVARADRTEVQTIAHRLAAAVAGTGTATCHGARQRACGARVAAVARAYRRPSDAHAAPVPGTEHCAWCGAGAGEGAARPHVAVRALSTGDARPEPARVAPSAVARARAGGSRGQAHAVPPARGADPGGIRTDGALQTAVRPAVAHFTVTSAGAVEPIRADPVPRADPVEALEGHGGARQPAARAPVVRPAGVAVRPGPVPRHGAAVARAQPRAQLPPVAQPVAGARDGKAGGDRGPGAQRGAPGAVVCRCADPAVRAGPVAGLEAAGVGERHVHARRARGHEAPDGHHHRVLALGPLEPVAREGRVVEHAHVRTRVGAHADGRGAEAEEPAAAQHESRALRRAVAEAPGARGRAPVAGRGPDAVGGGGRGEQDGARQRRVVAVGRRDRRGGPPAAGPRGRPDEAAADEGRLLGAGDVVHGPTAHGLRGRPRGGGAGLGLQEHHRTPGAEVEAGQREDGVRVHGAVQRRGGRVPGAPLDAADLREAQHRERAQVHRVAHEGVAPGGGCQPQPRRAPLARCVSHAAVC